MEIVEFASAVNDENYSGGLEKLSSAIARFTYCAKLLWC